MPDSARSSTLNGTAQPDIDGGGRTQAVAGAGGAAGAATLGRGAGTQHADGTLVRVLVVDDEPSLAELLSSVLRYEGWSVRAAGDGAEAVRTGREFRPDAVVLDIMLPDFDGIEVMRKLRAELPD
ncbi:MAG: response regulator, partial [Trebonia sp.]